MVKVIGIRPRADTQKMIGKFEDEVLIRHNNRQLIGTVYVDMQEDCWAVAFAYNYSRNPALHGPENPLEVRYSCPAQGTGSVRMFRSDADDEQTLKTRPFADSDAFICFVLAQERAQVCKAA